VRLAFHFSASAAVVERERATPLAAL